MRTATNFLSKNEWRFVAAALPPGNRFAMAHTRKSASKLQRKRCRNQGNELMFDVRCLVFDVTL